MLSAKTEARLALPAAVSIIVCALFAGGCRSTREASLIGTFRMGEKVQVGPLVYQVLESNWRNELGSGGRAPTDRFLFVRVNVTNSTAAQVPVPALSLESGGKTYTEITEGMDAVDNWLGLIRNVEPSRSEEGWVVFDAPMAAHKLVLMGSGDSENYAHVDIPVELD